MEEKFDLYIQDMPKAEPSFAEWKTKLRGIPNETRQILVINLTKVGACEKLKEIESLGGFARLLPTSYRTPLISLVEARSFALKYLQEFNASQKTRYKLGSEVEADGCWWQFRIGEEIIEGSLPNIRVSFLDGHLITVQEWGKWMRLSNSCA